MLNIEMLMEELEDGTKMHPPPDRKREVERILDDYESWMPTQQSCQMGVLGNGNNFIMEKWFNE